MRVRASHHARERLRQRYGISLSWSQWTKVAMALGRGEFEKVRDVGKGAGVYVVGLVDSHGVITPVKLVFRPADRIIVTVLPMTDEEFELKDAQP